MTTFASFVAWLLAALMPATVAMPSAWEGVSWGMSIEQAAKAFSVPHRPAEAAYNPDTKQMKFDYYQTGDITFNEGYLEFQNNQLTGRGMSLVDKGNCSSLFETMTDRYGKPVYETNWDDREQFPTDTTYTREAWWEDGGSDNRIVLKNVRDPDFTTCDLLYEPLKLLPGTHHTMELPPQPPQKLTPGAGGL